MQALWDTHPGAFSFAILKLCAKDELLDVEQQFIDRLKPELNTAPFATSSAGVKMTDAQRAKMRLRRQSIARRYDVDGEMLSVPEIAERTGLTVPGIRRRLREGHDLLAPDQRGTPQSLQIGDRQFTPREVAKEFALPLTTVYSRLALGWSGDQLTRPRLHRARNSE